MRAREQVERERNEQLALEQLGVPGADAVRVKPTSKGGGNVLALRKEDAARACGVSDETFDKHVRPTLPVVRMGSVRVYPVAAIDAWLRDQASTPMDELEAR